MTARQQAGDYSTIPAITRPPRDFKIGAVPNEWAEKLQKKRQL
jgi:hypothetical protein